MNERTNTLKESLAGRCCEKDLEPIHIQNFDASQLCYIDKAGNWKEIAPDKLSDKIRNEGPQDIVIKCDTEKMYGYNGIHTQIDSGFQEIGNVQDLFCEDGITIIETDEMFLCSEDIEAEIMEYKNKHQNHSQTRFASEFAKWNEKQDWNGDADWHSWDGAQGWNSLPDVEGFETIGNR